MHVHTNVGSYDSNLSPLELIHKGKAAGLDGVVVTEHDRGWDLALARNLARDHDFVLLCGMEVSTDLGYIQRRLRISSPRRGGSEPLPYRRVGCIESCQLRSIASSVNRFTCQWGMRWRSSARPSPVVCRCYSKDLPAVARRASSSIWRITSASPRRRPRPMMDRLPTTAIPGDFPSSPSLA